MLINRHIHIIPINHVILPISRPIWLAIDNCLWYLNKECHFPNRGSNAVLLDSAVKPLNLESALDTTGLPGGAAQNGQCYCYSASKIGGGGIITLIIKLVSAFHNKMSLKSECVFSIPVPVLIVVSCFSWTTIACTVQFQISLANGILRDLVGQWYPTKGETLDCFL